MSARNADYKLGYDHGIRAAITWLHKRADSMNDPRAQAVLNTAAFNFGNETRRVSLPASTDARSP